MKRFFHGALAVLALAAAFHLGAEPVKSRYVHYSATGIVTVCQASDPYELDPCVYDEGPPLLTDTAIEDSRAIFIDFAGDAEYYDDTVNRIDPMMYDVIEAYVGLTHGGFTAVSFALKVVPPAGAVLLLSFESLLPGGFYDGSWETGVTVSSSECMGHAELWYVGKLTMLYLTGAADIEIRDHPGCPRCVVDCDSELKYYVVANHGGVWKDPVSTPVEAMSWGAIKAMYGE